MSQQVHFHPIGSNVSGGYAQDGKSLVMWDDGGNECYVGLNEVLSLLAKAEKEGMLPNLPPEWWAQTKNLGIEFWHGVENFQEGDPSEREVVCEYSKI
tara:strand:+ start:1765 stop:2058 length:294 start_codon:yes stop_codon:yes gene_type:complete